MTGPPLLLVLDLVGTFAFGLNGALTAVRVARLDIVGVLALGVITALGGGIIRDVLIGEIPPATFRDSRYMALAVGGALVAFGLSRRLDRLETPIVVLDAVGSSPGCVRRTSDLRSHSNRCLRSSRRGRRCRTSTRLLTPSAQQRWFGRR